MDTDPDADDVLRTLLLPFEQSLLPRLEGVRVLLLDARATPSLPAAAKAWRLQQDFRPRADALAAAGYQSTPDLPAGEFDVVLLPAPRQRQHGRALLAQGLLRLARGGVLVAGARNDGGARSLQRDLEALVGPTHSLSKHRCRASWAVRESDGDAALAQQWLAADEPRAIDADGRFHSRPGVFAWDRVDPASALLAAQLPADLGGRGADLGCGYGFLAAAVLARNPGVAALDLYEADARALALARRNLEGAPAALGFHWHDVAAGLPRTDYDFIVSNPPFHEGRADAPELGIAFIRAAAQALRPGGRLFLVANRHLPYEASLAAGFADTRVLADEGGFKVLEARRA